MVTASTTRFEESDKSEATDLLKSISKYQIEFK